MPIKIYKDDKLVTTAYPEIRTYNRNYDDKFREVNYMWMNKIKFCTKIKRRERNSY